MPVFLNSDSSSNQRQSCAKGLCANPTRACIDGAGKKLTIGLINNMPDGALEATERQFTSLLASASEGLSVQLRLYSLPGIPRNGAAAFHVAERYSSTETLMDQHLDGLIVTGREPLTPELRDEPYWNSFTEIVEWARDNTYSTIWSCLAAHAAVLHLDGIRRVRSREKLCGIFEFCQTSGHPIMENAQPLFRLPHSRWNSLPESELKECGYSVLTRNPASGVDTFLKMENSLFLFFQGHPEYEPDSLLLEYRRDVGRFLRGEAASYPLLPADYFDKDTAASLTMLQNESRTSSKDLWAKLSNVLMDAKIENTWSSTAASIYRNWLQHLSARKRQDLMADRLVAKMYGDDRLTIAANGNRGAALRVVS